MYLKVQVRNERVASGPDVPNDVASAHLRALVDAVGEMVEDKQANARPAKGGKVPEQASNRLGLVVSELSAEQRRELKLNSGLLIEDACFRIQRAVSNVDDATLDELVARIVERRADSGVVLDSRFIPPMLHVNAHQRLRTWVDELHGLVRQRAEALSARIATPGTKGVADFADFLLLMACNRYEPLLHHWRMGPQVHPLKVYAELLKLAGECATFAQESRRPPSFEPYAHERLADTFEPVIEEIRRAMAAVLEQNAVQIALRDLGKGLFGADIPDPHLIRQGYFVLAAAAQVPKEQLRGTLPTQVKIGPPEKIRDLVMTMVPGVRIEPIEAPRQIPYHANYTYFQLDPRSEFWSPIELSRRLALYVAGDLPGLDLQMWAIRQ